MSRIKYKGKYYTEKEYKKKKSDEQSGVIAVVFGVLAAAGIFLNLPGMTLITVMSDPAAPIDSSEVTIIWAIAAFVSFVLFFLVKLTAKSWKRGLVRYSMVCALTGVVVVSGGFGSSPDLADKFVNLYFPDSSDTPTLAAAKHLSSANVYVVVAGDTLSKIANNVGTSVPVLKQRNGLSTNLIYPGQELRY